MTRRRRVTTTRRDEHADRPPDLVERRFCADWPNALWVTDLTFVSTWAGVAYVCFIVDAFSRRIVGWRVAAHMRTAMVLDALEMARWQRGTRLDGLVAHSDAGSPSNSPACATANASPSSAPSRRSGRSATRSTTRWPRRSTACTRAELIYGPEQGPWRSIEAVELATLGWVAWYNTQRLHGYLNDLPPAEFEDAYHARTTDQQLVGNQ